MSPAALEISLHFGIKKNPGYPLFKYLYSFQY